MCVKHLFFFEIVVEENGVKLRLSIVDTPGFGDQLNSNKAWDPIVQYIQTQYQIYHKEESAVTRKRHIPDSRVHVVLYFIAPNGQAYVVLSLLYPFKDRAPHVVHQFEAPGHRGHEEPG